MTKNDHDLATADVIREVRSFTELISASVDQLMNEDAGRPVDRTPMLAWNATHGRYEIRASSLDELQTQLTKIIEAKWMAASLLIMNLALRVKELDPGVTLTDVVKQVEKRVIEDLAAREEGAQHAPRPAVGSDRAGLASVVYQF